jgi:hypothetical protein
MSKAKYILRQISRNAKKIKKRQNEIQKIVIIEESQALKDRK